MTVNHDANGSEPPSKHTELSPLLSEKDLEQIWKWNSSTPPQIRGTVHDLISEVAKRDPEAVAVCAWDGQWTYSELETLSNRVALKLVSSGIEPTSIIPILFSKSKWTPIAMLVSWSQYLSFEALHS